MRRLRCLSVVQRLRLMKLAFGSSDRNSTSRHSSLGQIEAKSTLKNGVEPVNPETVRLRDVSRVAHAAARARRREGDGSSG